RGVVTRARRTRPSRARRTSRPPRPAGARRGSLLVLEVGAGLTGGGDMRIAVLATDPAHLAPRWRGEDLARQRFGAATRRPLPRVPQGDLLEPDVVVAGGPGDVEVAVDTGPGTVAAVPVRGLLRPAPQGEVRVSQDLCRLPQEGPVIHQHGRLGGFQLGQAPG